MLRRTDKRDRYQTWHLCKLINPISYGWYLISECMDMDICKISFLSQSWAAAHARRCEAQAQTVNGRIKAVGLEPKPPSSLGLLILTYLQTVNCSLNYLFWNLNSCSIVYPVAYECDFCNQPVLWYTSMFSHFHLASHKKLLSETRKITNFTNFRAGCYIGVLLNWLKFLNHLHLFLKCSSSSRSQ